MAFFLGWMRGFSVKSSKYGEDNTILKKADMLFLQQNYQQAYETLQESKVDFC